MALEKIRFPIALVWVVVVLFLTWSLYKAPPGIKTDLVELFLKANGNDSLSKYVPKLLAENSNKIIFVVQAKTLEQVLDASAHLKESILRDKDSNLGLIEPDEVLNEMLVRNKAQIYEMIGGTELSQLSGARPIEKLKGNILSKLSSPIGSYFSRFLEFDPLLLLPDTLLRLREGVPGEFSSEGMVTHSEGNVVLTFFAERIGQNLSDEGERKAFAAISKAIADVGRQFATVEIKWTGFFKFAYYTKQLIEKEIKFFSQASTIAIVLIVFWFFRTLRPIFLTTVSVLVGILFGFTFVGIFGNSIHMLTIGFGSCLVGACVDYALHYLTELALSEDTSSEEVVMGVFNPITIGACTTIISFLSLILTGFLGLQELAIFAIGSVFGSYLTVFSLFPVFSPQFLRSKSELALKATKIQALSILVFRSKMFGTLFIASVLVLLLVGFSRLRFNDDVRLLQPQNKDLISEVSWMQERNKISIPSANLILTEKLNIKTRTNLIKFLKHQKDEGSLSGYLDSGPLVRSQLERRESMQRVVDFVSSEHANIAKMFDEVGIGSDISRNFFKQVESKDNAHLEDSSDSLGIVLYGLKDRVAFTDKLAQLDLGEESGIVFYDQVTEVSKMFERYRDASILYIILAYLGILVLLMIFYSKRDSLRAFASSFLGGLMSIAMLGLLGVPVNFFSILALVIVLGLGIDYTVFLLEKRSGGQSAKLSVLLSVITTTITFGLFSFSSAPMLQGMAIVVSFGVVFSYLSANYFITRVP